MQSARRDRGRGVPGWLAALVLLTGAAAALWVWRIHLDPPGDHGAMLQSDSFRYFHPGFVFLHRELRAGHLPLWNPYQLAGQPYLALHVPAVLYPPNLLFAAMLSPTRALEAHAVVHMALAGFFTWLFAGRVGLGSGARLAAAAGYMFSAPLFLGFYMPPFLSTPAWLPAILWALHALLEERRARWSVLLAGFVALAFLGGYTQALVYELQLALLYGAVGLGIIARGRSLVRIAGLVAIAAVLALGFSAPQLLPALELFGQAVRGLEGLTYEQAAISYVSPEMLLQGALRPFGTALTSPPPGLLRWLVTLPVFALPVMLCGLLDRALRPFVVLFGVGAVVVGLLSLGFRGPLFELYFALPIGDLFRNAGRIAFVYAFLTSMLVACGIEALVRRTVRAADGGRLAVVASGVLVLGVAADFGLRSGLDHAHPAAVPVTRGADAELIEYLASRPDHRRTYLENFGFYHLGSLYKFGMMNGVFVVPDYEPSMPDSYRAFFGVPDTPPWHGQLHVVSDAAAGSPANRVDARHLDLMSVGYYAIRTPAPDGALREVRAVAGGPSRRFGTMELVQRSEGLPRAYAVRRVARVPDFESALRRIAEASFRPRQEAVVTARAGEAVGVSGVAGREGDDRAAIVAYASDEVSLEARCLAPCLLVLTDLYYPGWRVAVDGVDRPIEQVNGIFRGVQLDPGEHRVVYRFEPWTFRAGTAAFAVTLIAAAWLWRRG